VRATRLIAPTRRWPAASLLALGLAAAALGCEGGGRGALCQTDAECSSDLRCAARAGESRRVCMSVCSADAGRLVCDEGEVCLEYEDTFLCWLGGRTPLDTTCIDSFQCEPGTICRDGVCRQVCQTGCADTCYSSYQSCVDNVCEDTPDAWVETPDANIPLDTDAGQDAGQDAGIDGGQDAACALFGY